MCTTKNKRVFQPESWTFLFPLAPLTVGTRGLLAFFTLPSLFFSAWTMWLDITWKTRGLKINGKKEWSKRSISLDLWILILQQSFLFNLFNRMCILHDITEESVAHINHKGFCGKRYKIRSIHKNDEVKQIFFNTNVQIFSIGVINEGFFGRGWGVIHNRL